MKQQLMRALKNGNVNKQKYQIVFHSTNGVLKVKSTIWMVGEKYIGVKNEISSKKENRNYLFHINSSKKYKNVWTVIPGKFTLEFSMAPEFYRIVYKKNPKKFFKTFSNDEKFSHLVEETIWQEIQKKE